MLHRILAFKYNKVACREVFLVFKYGATLTLCDAVLLRVALHLGSRRQTLRQAGEKRASEGNAKDHAMPTATRRRFALGIDDVLVEPYDLPGCAEYISKLLDI